MESRFEKLDLTINPDFPISGFWPADRSKRPRIWFDDLNPAMQGI